MGPHFRSLSVVLKGKFGVVITSLDAVCVIHKPSRLAPFKALLWWYRCIVQELCESRGGRPELSVLTSLLASVDVKIY